MDSAGASSPTSSPEASPEGGLFRAGDLDVGDAEGGHGEAGFEAGVGGDGVEAVEQIEDVGADQGAFDGVEHLPVADEESEVDAGGDVSAGGVGSAVAARSRSACCCHWRHWKRL